MMRFAAALAVVVCCSITGVYAAQNERVMSVSTGGELQLEKTGRAVFTNILAPNVPRMEAWLAKHSLQQEINVVAGDEDRYGRTHITSDIQQKMLRDGVVLAYATGGEIPLSWRVAETQARAAKRGVWAKDSLVISPEAALQTKSGFHLVEGAITRIYESKAGTYLNFGDDWRSDFSIAILPKQRRSMKAFLANLKAGDRIRVRGSLVQENGPMIRLNHADNLEKI